MRRKIAMVLFLLLLLVATCVAQLNMMPRLAVVLNVRPPAGQAERAVARRDTPPTGANSTTASSSPDLASSVTPKTGVTSPPAEPGPAGVKTGIDIARISRDGPSVFAGTAAPNARVTVLDGTKEVATATANGNGDWSTVTDYKFANSDPDIRLKSLEPEANVAEASGKPPPAPVLPASASPSVALMQSFENVVAAAREDAKKAGGPTSPATTAPAGLATTVTPVPMTFVYDQDVLTAEGHHSTELLLEYLKLKHFATVTLSGHADERGTADYNMDLSRKRLETIFRNLRDGGFAGKLTLVPKGSSEPYRGVDRARYQREDLMQLDRRVELRAAE